MLPLLCYTIIDTVLRFWLYRPPLIDKLTELKCIAAKWTLPIKLSVRSELLCFLLDHVRVYAYIVKSKLNQGLQILDKLLCP